MKTLKIEIDLKELKGFLPVSPEILCMHIILGLDLSDMLSL